MYLATESPCFKMTFPYYFPWIFRISWLFMGFHNFECAAMVLEGHSTVRNCLAKSGNQKYPMRKWIQSIHKKHTRRTVAWRLANSPSPLFQSKVLNLRFVVEKGQHSDETSGIFVPWSTIRTYSRELGSPNDGFTRGSIPRPHIIFSKSTLG